IIGSQSYGPIKEFTVITCECIYHQMCLKRDLMKHCGKAICPNWDCKGREIKTSISPAVLQDKSTTPTVDTTSKQVDSGDQTPVDEADVILMNELGILGEEEQSSSKTTVIAKETSNQATSQIEVVSTMPSNSKNVDDS